ncbi:helix-turn-helix domain-containing protein [Amycolatopsis sp. WGS_07]|uniref:helix-turn-helix domain-containing protein n=1 Tax=Amycolatopsis sp. WGS_07 TaxID=3076764 RepID=UPI0038734841
MEIEHFSAEHPVDLGEIQRLLGDALREQRRRRGLTRAAMSALLGGDVAPSTVAAYENGIRHCSVLRLVQLCAVLDTTAHEILARVGERGPYDDEALLVDLRRVRCDPDAPEPLRRWASVLVDQHVNPYRELRGGSLPALGTLTGTDPGELRRILARARAERGGREKNSGMPGSGGDSDG